MNTLIALTLVALAITLTAGQNVRANRGGGRRGAGVQAADAAGNSLQASSRDLDAQQALLQKKQAQQARLDRRAARKERKRARAAKAEAARLEAEAALDYETFENEAAFNNLDATANKQSADKFGLQIFSDNKNLEQAAISSSDGHKFSTGTRLSHDSFLDTEWFDKQEAIEEEDLFDGEELSAAGASEDIHNAKEEIRQENEQTIDAQNAAQSQAVGQTDSLFGNNNFFGNSNPFGGFSGAFGRK